MAILCVAFLEQVLGALYGEMTEQQDDVQNRFGVFGFICIFLGIQAIAAASSFNETRDVFIDDRNVSVYNRLPFWPRQKLIDLVVGF